MSGNAGKQEKTGLGYEIVKRDGEVSVEKGELMIRRTNGQQIVVNGKEQIYTGDELGWVAGCTFIIQEIER